MIQARAQFGQVRLAHPAGNGRRSCCSLRRYRFARHLYPQTLVRRVLRRRCSHPPRYRGRRSAIAATRPRHDEHATSIAIAGGNRRYAQSSSVAEILTAVNLPSNRIIKPFTPNIQMQQAKTARRSIHTLVVYESTDPRCLDALHDAKAYFRAGDYERVRRLASLRGNRDSEDAALFWLDACAARLQHQPVPAGAPRFDAREPSSDDAVYYRAFAAWLDRDFGTANALLCDHRPHSTNGRSAFLILRGWIAGADSRLSEQIALTTQALESLLDSEEQADGFLVSNASLALAALAREMPSEASRILLERALPRIERPTYAGTLLHVRRAIAQMEALQGRYTTALRHLTFAGELAHTPIERAFLHFDYAAVAAWAKQGAAAESAFDVAYDAIADIAFAEHNDESAFALTVGAIAGSRIARLKAQHLAKRAAAAIPQMSARWAVSRGLRAAALVDEALALTTDDVNDAVHLGSRASEAFESIGYDWRAGRLSAHLYELTGQAMYRARAQRLLEPYAAGPLAVRVDRTRLTPQMRKIVALIQKGRRTEDIARELKLAPSTVNTHIKRIFMRCGVHSRTQLLAYLFVA